MNLGLVHLIRAATFDRLRKSERLWQHFSAELNEAGPDNALAAQVLEQTHGLLHSPLSARFAPTSKPSGAVSPRSKEAAERVVAAYRKSKQGDAPPPTPSMWDTLTGERREFLDALERSDAGTVQRLLEHLFDSPLVHGLGQMHTSHLPLLNEGISWLHFNFTDTFVSLAEAVGGSRVSCMGQDAPDHLRPLHRDLSEVFNAVVPRLGFVPDYPDVCGAFGFRVMHKLVSIDSLTHAYAAYRLAQLGAEKNSSVYELGGGYGGLALMAHRAGIGRYAIYDLPWVNALQGYFLIVSLPEGVVRLHGETAGTVRVEPYWHLYTAAENACDFSVNSDSLPEMGEATAADYLGHLRRITRTAFLSINQEAKAHYSGVGPQNCVAELIDAVGGFRRLSRQRHWLRQGYVEEVFEPVK